MITAPKALNQSSARYAEQLPPLLRKSLSVETLHSTSRQNGVSPQALASESQPDEAILRLFGI